MENLSIKIKIKLDFIREIQNKKKLYNNIYFCNLRLDKFVYVFVSFKK